MANLWKIKVDQGGARWDGKEPWDGKKPRVNNNPQVVNGDKFKIDCVSTSAGFKPEGLEIYAVPRSAVEWGKENLAELKDFKGINGSYDPAVPGDFCTCSPLYNTEYTYCYNPGRRASLMEWSLIFRYRYFNIDKHYDKSPYVVESLDISTDLTSNDAVDWHIKLDDKNRLDDEPTTVEWVGGAPDKDNPLKIGHTLVVEGICRVEKDHNPSLQVFATHKGKEDVLKLYYDHEKMSQCEVMRKNNGINGFFTTPYDSIKTKELKHGFHDSLKFTYDPSPENIGVDMGLVFMFGDPHIESTTPAIDKPGT